ncbi:radical SAM protein [Candidatus Woesebacteria bacterium]|nr:radical SAM protein [Candidatus Woesebacteria bacterium]
MKIRKTLSIAVGYPPIISKKGVPLLSQNRQFQYFNAPTYIYPMVPAYAASYLQECGYRVFWMDGIAERKTVAVWFDELKKNRPDFFLLETKSPIVKKHWILISKMKKAVPGMEVILVGDHPSFAPYEQFENSEIDYVIKGGDYDFVTVNLLNHILKGEELEGGVYWRASNQRIKGSKDQRKHTLENGEVILNSGLASLKHDLNKLPFVDRDLTKWELYAYANGNYKFTPGTYMYSGRDCWWNKCTFCVWDHTINPIGSYRSFTPERLFAEVKHVVDNYGIKEIFDDAGTMFVGNKLKKFCELLIESGYNKKVRYGCNMRFNAIPTQELYDLMGKAGFRFILYGMESGNQKTLDKLEKGTKEQDAIIGPAMARKSGLDPHITIMLGYPWESYEDAKRTIETAKYAMKKGYYETIQATIVIPYPGTPLYRECKEKGWLLTDDYERFDMREPVMKIPFSHEKLLELEQDLYSTFMTPQYIGHKILRLRTFHDIKYLFYMAYKFLGHMLDFDPNQTQVQFTSPKFWKNTFGSLFSHFSHSKTSVDDEKDVISKRVK